VLRGVSTFGATFLTTFFFLGFATMVFFLTTFFLGAGFLALVLDLLAVLAVFFLFFAADVFVSFFLPAVVVALLVVFFFAVGNARGVLREKKRGRAATTREGRAAGDDDKVGSRPTRFVSVLRAGRRANAWRTNKENMTEGVTALGRKKTKPRCYFDNGINNGTNTNHCFVVTKFLEDIDVAGSGSLTHYSRNPSSVLPNGRSLGGDQVSRPACGNVHRPRR
jgi:hypothetical protein